MRRRGGQLACACCNRGWLGRLGLVGLGVGSLVCTRGSGIEASVESSGMLQLPVS